MVDEFKFQDVLADQIELKVVIQIIPAHWEIHGFLAALGFRHDLYLSRELMRIGLGIQNLALPRF